MPSASTFRLKSPTEYGSNFDAEIAAANVNGFVAVADRRWFIGRNRDNPRRRKSCWGLCARCLESRGACPAIAVRGNRGRAPSGAYFRKCLILDGGGGHIPTQGRRARPSPTLPRHLPHQPDQRVLRPPGQRHSLGYTRQNAPSTRCRVSSWRRV